MVIRRTASIAALKRAWHVSLPVGLALSALACSSSGSGSSDAGGGAAGSPTGTAGAGVSGSAGTSGAPSGGAADPGGAPGGAGAAFTMQRMKFVGDYVNLDSATAPYGGSHRFYSLVAGHSGFPNGFPIAAINIAFGVSAENANPTF